jgi:hypothetical protein
MFNLIGLLSILWFSDRFARQSLRRIALCAAVLLTVVPIGYVLVLEIIPRFNGMTTRVLWPQAEISQRMTEIWSKETGQPLRIVSGNAWIAGLVGLTAKDRPSLLNQGELKFSPWITPTRIDAQGMLVVWDARDRGPPKALQPWLRSRRVREETFDWPRSRGRAPLVIRYAIVRPKPGAL